MCERKSIFNEIKNTEASIQDFYYRIETIERNLRTNYLNTEEREKLEDELEDIKVFLSKSEKDLKGLHKENRKSFAFSAFIVLAVFVMYSLYVVIIGL